MIGTKVCKCLGTKFYVYWRYRLQYLHRDTGNSWKGIKGSVKIIVTSIHSEGFCREPQLPLSYGILGPQNNKTPGQKASYPSE